MNEELSTGQEVPQQIPQQIPPIQAVQDLMTPAALGSPIAQVPVIPVVPTTPIPTNSKLRVKYIVILIIL